MGTKKRSDRPASRSKQNGAGRNSAKTRPDFQTPEARQAAEHQKSHKESHAGTGAGAPGVPDAPEGGNRAKVRRKHDAESAR
jgi:hypothetical protein